MLDGAEGVTWSDALLTEVGQGQARDVNGLWEKLLPKGIPPPETYYVSPLTRTIETADLSFKGLDLPHGKQYRPYIKEVRLFPAILTDSIDFRAADEGGSGGPHVRPSKHSLSYTQDIPTHHAGTRFLRA